RAHAAPHRAATPLSPPPPPSPPGCALDGVPPRSRRSRRASKAASAARRTTFQMPTTTTMVTVADGLDKGVSDLLRDRSRARGRRADEGRRLVLPTGAGIGRLLQAFCKHRAFAGMSPRSA